MPRCVRSAFAILLLLAPLAGAYAAIGPAPLPGPGPHLQLLVIEVPRCFYCRLFRRDVVPFYEASPHARELPLHFLDAETASARRLDLKRPIETVPTIVLMRGGKEVARLSGYPDAPYFMRAIRYFLSRQQ